MEVHGGLRVRILAIDSGTQTGWASNSAGKVISGTQDFSLKRGESSGMRFLMFRKWLDNMIKTTNVELIIYERAHHRGGSPTEVGVGLTTLIQTACSEHDIEYVALHSATLKKFATGKGNACKEDMMVEAVKKGWDFKDDNEADALWLLDYAIENYG